MKSLLTVLLAGCWMSLTSGCGLGAAADAAKEVPGKMDVLNAKMDETRDAIARTNEAIHLQVLKFSMDDMLKAENTRYLQPPIDMMPGGKMFAEEVRPEELLLLLKAKFLGITYDAVNDFDPACSNPGAPSCTQARYELDLKKVVDYSAMLVVAGFLQQTKVEEIVRVQVPHGEYLEEGYKMLYLRHAFLLDIRIGQMAMAPGLKLSSLERVREAVARVSELQYVEDLPFADRVAIRISTLHPPFADAYNLDGTPVDRTQARPLWRRIGQALETDLDAATRADPKAMEEIFRYRELVRSRS
jgi:hypothetical protein